MRRLHAPPVRLLSHGPIRLAGDNRGRRTISPRNNAYVFGCLTLWGCAVILYLTGPYRTQFPLAVFPVSLYFLGHLTFRRIRFDLMTPLSPGNVTQLIFFLQLVVIPLLIIDSGFAQGVLMYLPGPQAIDTATAIQAVAFLAFAVGFTMMQGRHPTGPVERPAASARTVTRAYPVAMGVAFLVLGLFGFFQLFSSWSAYTSYLADPHAGTMIFETNDGTVQGAISTFFRPFLPFAFVFFWARWVDMKGTRKGVWRAVLFTVLVGGLTCLAYLSYSFNRGAIIAPLLGILAVFSRSVRRIPILLLITLGGVIFYGSLILGEYRSTAQGAAEPELLAEKVKVVDWIQVYGSAPQYSGFLIQHMDFGRNLQWGRTILASLLHPVPILGKDFRQTSGVELYNRLIYGLLPSSDQVIPSAAEWFVNFHIPGVLAAFMLLGVTLAACNRAFLRAENSFLAYSIFLASVWLSFVVVGSIAVLSQIFVYFFWPVYAYVLWRSVGMRAVAKI